MYLPWDFLQRNFSFFYYGLLESLSRTNNQCNQLFQSVVNNPSNKILSEGLLEKRVAGQLTIKGDTGFSTHTKLKQADTFINKSSSMVIYFWLTVFILSSFFFNYNIVISNVSHFSLTDIFRFVKFTIQFILQLNKTQSIQSITATD